MITIITGAFSSGKSTILNKYSKNKNNITISCDEIIRALYRQKHIQKQVQKILNINEFSSDNIKKVIYTNKNKKYKLELFIQNQLFIEITKYINRSMLKNMNLIIEMPLFYETNFYINSDEVICVHDVDFIRKSRGLKRVDINTLNNIESAQFSSFAKLNRATSVIYSKLY
jgi:dephospho-CoA kinase